MGIFDDIPSPQGAALPQSGTNWSDVTDPNTGRPHITINKVMDPRARDLLIRTVYGEAGNQPDEGKAAVAAVVKNRVDSGRYGDSIPAIVLARNQFEPWQRPDARSKMLSLAPDDPHYQSIGSIVDGIFSGQSQDPTNGATHFFAPQAQAALGRPAPAWAKDPTAQIGGHVFFAPEGKRQQVTQADLPPPQGQQAPQPAQTPRVSIFDDIPTVQQPSVADRSNVSEGQRPDMAPAMRQAATAMTTGQAAPPGVQMLVGHENLLSGASQGTNPNASAHQNNLISSDVFQGDDGSVQFRDPATGRVVPTDASKHIAIRDPADNTLKIYGRSDATNEGSAVGAARVLSPGLAAGAPTLRPAMPLVSAATKTPTRQEVMGAAKQGYNAFKDSGLEISAPAITNLSKEISAGINEAGFLDVLAPKTHGVLSKFAEAPDGSFVSAVQLHGLRKAIGKAAGSTDPTEKAAASVAMRKLDQFMANIPDDAVKSGNAAGASATLTEANQNYAAAKRAEQVGTAEGRAQLNASSAGSGANIDNTTRQAFKSLLRNPKLMRGWSEEEVQQVKKIVDGTFVGNAARLIGKLAPTGIVSSGLSGGTGFAIGGPAGAVAFPAIGYVAKKLADGLTAGQVDKLEKLILSRSPHAQAIEASSRAWQEAAEGLTANPRSAKLGAFLLASRNLSNNLSDAGISITAHDFIRALQAPLKSAADPEQEPQPRIPGE
jgi:spore germination cell wall hydrolase CwlJ-like protein